MKKNNCYLHVGRKGTKFAVIRRNFKSQAKEYLTAGMTKMAAQEKLKLLLG